MAYTTLSELRTIVKGRLRLTGTQADGTINDYINESILEFYRYHDWDKLLTTGTITTDDSDTYTITTELSSTEFTIIKGIFIDADSSTNDNEWKKRNLLEYLRLATKTYYFALAGDTIYLSGDGDDFTVVYYDIGATYPLVSDSQYNNVTTYYGEIIAAWATFKTLDYFGDEKATQSAKIKLAEHLERAKRQQARAEKMGRTARVSAYNRKGY